MGEYLKMLFVDPSRLPGGEAFHEICAGLTEGSKPWEEAGCDVGGGFGFIQVLFFLIAYGYILFKASNLISDGSELLLLIPSLRDLVGSIVLPILGAVPDGAIVLFSGLGDNAQEEVAVGVGALAGSTIMLLTLPWALSIFFGRVDIEDGKCQYTKPKKTPEGTWSKVSGKKSIFFGTGVEPKPLVRTTALIMIVTAASYLLIQGPAFFSPAHGIKEKETEEITKHSAELQRYWALAGLIVCTLFFIAYLVYQVMVAKGNEVVKDKIEATQAFAIKNGILNVSTLFYDDLKKAAAAQSSSRDALLESQSEHERMVQILRGFFKRYDFNKDNHIDMVEFQQLLHDLGEKLTTPEMEALIKRIDTDHSGRVNFDEFVAAMPTFILERVESRLPKGHAVIAEAPDEVEEEDEEEIPEDLAHLDPHKMMRAVKFRAFWQMALGTILVLIFSDPMCDVLNDIGRRLNVPAFYISFVLAPLASNASELLATCNYAFKKTQKTITISFSTLLGAAVMNNTFCLGIFLLLIFARGMAWQFSAETISILFVELCLFGVSMKKRQTVFDACLILALLPISLIVVALLESYGLD
eukprot:comp12181_c0_seq1/m.6937 comp12181_c0_seq1/g.6937  ORF comp12181_c0_seq1/g.6937 comp12181_c0_seq1/m.6937 type:complete len:583 (-) comp12181_c0_seq1:478-2226(-)